jgi:hypothetical protein
MCGRQEDSGVIIMVPPAGREEIGISAATSIGTTRLAVDNTVTLTGRGSTMILLGSTNPPYTIEFTQGIASLGALSPPRDTFLSHTADAESCPKPPDRSSDGREGCRTTMSHRRRPTGLWLRGTVYQYRVRVPVEVRERLGRSHVNRSLHTSSYTDAVRAARKVAFEIEGMFNAALLGSQSNTGDAVCVGAGSPPPSQSMTAEAVLLGTPSVPAQSASLVHRRIQRIHKNHAQTRMLPAFWLNLLSASVH